MGTAYPRTNDVAPTALMRRKTTFTREGLFWLLASIGLWLTGWLKGINLILLLAYLLLLLWGLNWLAARRALRGAVIRRAVREPIFAGLPATWEVEVSVVGPRPAIGWEVVDEGPAHAARWFLASTAPGEGLHLRRDVTLSRRGPYGCPPLRAVSSFPFGLVRQEVQFGVAERLMVLPRLGRIHAERLRRWLMQSARPDERARRSRRRLALEAEFHGLRQFRPGDSPRWIHWRTTARTGELVVREFDHGTHHDLVLIVEPFADGADSEAVEAAVSLAATVCWAWSQEAGDRVTLAIAGPEPMVLTSGDAPGAVLDLMEALASVTGTSQINADALAGRLLERPLLAGPALLISSRPDPRTAEELTRSLDRPVAYLNAASKPSFYQPPGTGGTP
jgi:uncharacterized protein (DUF58 family)